MGWSFRIARIWGIDVRVHVTFLLLLAFFAFAGYRQDEARGALMTTAFILLLFLCVLLHEFGHALAAAQVRDQDAGHHAAADRRRRPAAAHAGQAVAGAGRRDRRAAGERGDRGGAVPRRARRGRRGADGQIWPTRRARPATCSARSCASTSRSCCST